MVVAKSPPTLTVRFVYLYTPIPSSNYSVYITVFNGKSAMMDIDTKRSTKSALIDETPQSPQTNDDAAKKAFLASFSEQEDKIIMRKVDRRFLSLIGILYMTKNAITTVDNVVRSAILLDNKAVLLSERYHLW